jgi:hypothetical protein
MIKCCKADANHNKAVFESIKSRSRDVIEEEGRRRREGKRGGSLTGLRNLHLTSDDVMDCMRPLPQ